MKVNQKQKKTKAPLLDYHSMIKEEGVYMCPEICSKSRILVIFHCTDDSIKSLLYFHSLHDTLSPLVEGRWVDLKFIKTDEQVNISIV